MDPEVGDLAYDDNAALKYGALDYGDCHPAVKVMLYSKATSDDDDETDATSDWSATDEDDEPLDVATGQTQMVIAEIQRLVRTPMHNYGIAPTSNIGVSGIVILRF